MIRGWRNDPKWVEYYERKRAEYFARRVALVRLEWDTQDDIERVRSQIEEMKNAALRQTEAA